VTEAAARIASECYSDLVLRVPWYVAWPLVIGVTALALQFVAARSVYFPTHYPEGLWSLQAQLGAIDVWLDLSDHVRIHGWFVACPGSRRVTLFLHGNAGNITYRSQRFREITAAGSSVLMIDYRGYGKSTGRPSENGLYADAQAAYDYLLKTIRPQDIVVHGESLGTAAAVDLASRHQCGGVVLEAAFTAASDVAGTVLPVIGPLLIRSFDSRRKIKRVQAPILFIHGSADHTIPMQLGRALFDAAPEPKSFWVIPGADHNDIVERAGPEYRKRLRSFHESLAAPPGE
jgi:fermentation-respiration switch protein FrsA (DUF1100 family)